MEPSFWRTDRDQPADEPPLRRGRSLHRVTHGVYVASSLEIDPGVRALAMLQVCPSAAALSHHTAALWWGGTVPDVADVHVSATQGSARSRRGLVLHRRSAPVEVVTHGSARVTTPRQTFLDLACVLSLVDLVVLGDSLVGRGHLTPEALRTYLASARGRGVVAARQAAAYVRAGVDSPMESRLRMLLVLAGYPEPQVNLILRGDTGEWVYRLDLAWPTWRLALEYDGRQHAESTVQWRKDIRKRETLANLGWRMMSVVASDVYAGPAGFLDRLDEVLMERGVRPPRRRAGWQRHFPGRGAGHV